MQRVRKMLTSVSKIISMAECKVRYIFMPFMKGVVQAIHEHFIFVLMYEIDSSFMISARKKVYRFRSCSACAVFLLLLHIVGV